MRRLLCLLPLSVAWLHAASATCAGALEIAYTLTWAEVHAGTNIPVSSPNGLVEPGEGVLFRVSAVFSPPVGTLIQAPGSPTGSVVVAGLHRAIFGMAPAAGTGEEFGQWSHIASSAPFTPNSTIIFGGAIGGSATQLSQGGSWLPDPMNPIPRLWEIVYTPDHYDPRTMIYQLRSQFSQLFNSIWGQYGVDPTTGHPLLLSFFIPTAHYDTVSIPVIPAPGAAVVILPALLAAAAGRRRPRRA